MLLKLAGIALAVPVAGAAAVASMGVLVVDVRQPGPAGHHLVIPVPLLPVRAAAAFVPPGTGAVDLGHEKHLDPEAVQGMKMAGKILDALAVAPDGELVRVEEPNESVVIRKEGDRLRIDVQSKHDDQVEVTVPISLARTVIEDAQDGVVEPANVLRAVAACPRGNLVAVHSKNGEDVRIRVF
jgi:hypothetical protein